MIVKYLEFPIGNRAYGAGGWSRNAKCRPAPELKILNLSKNQIKFSGKSVFIAGIRKLKVNIFTNGGKTIRADYPEIGFRTDTI